MLAIPIPFVVSLMLATLAVTLHVRYSEQAPKAMRFILLCALTTGVVGLRWTYNLPIIAILQPILASFIPIVAWITFAHPNEQAIQRIAKHFLAPLLVALCATTRSFWALPLDELLTGIYLFYGMALIRHSTREASFNHISFGCWENAKRAANIAGWMLMFSALIDGAMSLDFAVNQGKLAPYILSVGHLVLLPILSLTVVTVAMSSAPIEETSSQKQSSEKGSTIADKEPSLPIITRDQAKEIVSALELLMNEKSAYLDPELTLSKLSRKLCIPAKHISIAVNMLLDKNISKLINEYRIEHAKCALQQSDQTVTQIMMNSGFQTKSNFNREFSRVTGMTPSQFRQRNQLAT
ncbi:helix-turn-helix transcriptional regulator [Vibrio vulnificus]|uniref:helix-turn-helix domain-containing protein n=1 Tax=Vibrio vulnificus TaxID=672 RepID=UPI000CD308DC|nr:AraC family transcriptional regulator [Vibrio vulnificus]EIO3980787.1 helix-turn-helix transcriptional regulator [Vibrio vulnificus]EJU9864498.1 helix-turn-helix transcriptional regulator [Vibrio vulnificus]ELH9432100.1 helix-turn-helix transcriptional regulator [Vibrio vulnificus]ELL0558984.1 helix-turn-helix transcriptional regulator [Vibrio vulnificus]POC50678.1 AraC family transcriptional regulator [Vibrio vulnificus]